VKSDRLSVELFKRRVVERRHSLPATSPEPGSCTVDKRFDAAEPVSLPIRQIYAATAQIVDA
jgi:hypothetical protein